MLWVTGLQFLESSKDLRSEDYLYVLTSHREHLYRCHMAPRYCSRCWLVFQDQDSLDKHMRAAEAEICQTTPGQPPEGITPDIARRLRSRKKTTRIQNERQRWDEVYRILFPDKPIPNPGKC